MDCSRRHFLQLAGCVTTVAVAGNVLSKVAQAAQGAPNLEACVAMSPLAMAEDSPMVQAASHTIGTEINALKNSALRALVSGIYTDSTPQLAARLDAATRKSVWEELSAKGYTKQDVNAFLPPVPANLKATGKAIAAPGSGYQSHHSYPGGLMTHVATNVLITRAIVDTYINVYGYEVDRDIAMAAQLLHDLHKPYVFQWNEDGSSRKEQPLAGTGEHHALSCAELMVRNAPAELVVAQCCAHTHPGNPQEEAQVVGWIKAAAIIAGVDPVRYGVLDASGETLPLPRKQEGFLCHLGDHDFVLSVPAVQWTLPVMKEIAQTQYGLSEKDCEGKPFNSLRNYVYSRYSAMRLEQVLATEGKDGVRTVMTTLVPPKKA